MRYLLLMSLGLIMKVINWAIWGYVILSWFARPYSQLWNIYSKLSQLMEPALAPFRKLLQPLTYRTGLDFSPYLLALCVSFIYRLLAVSIIRL